MRRPDERKPEGLSELEQIELLVESYLDGLLSPQDTARFERRLLEPAVADAFREALLIRQLLADMPPDQPPAELVASLEAALVAHPDLVRKAMRLPRLRAALSGMSWMVRGPALALPAAAAARGGSQAPVREGLSTLRYALGPLAVGSGQRKPAGRSWLRRILALGLRRSSKDGK
jgi:hypothetical protein